MLYTNYKKISYILSEKTGLSGRIAFEILNKIISINDVLEFTFYGQSEHNKSIDLLFEMFNNIVIIPSKNNEKKFVIKNIIINDKLIEILSIAGMFPNYLKISKLESDLEEEKKDYFWSMEFCDEILNFSYREKFFDDSKISLIEKEFLTKGLFYERKEVKKIKLKNKHHF